MELTEMLNRILDKFTGEKREILLKAYEVAAEAHSSQVRDSGVPYITHPVRVALILAEDLEMDFETIVAGILHDVIEDSDITYSDLESRFGSNIAALVDGVTKLSRLSERSRTEQQAHNLHKMFLAMAKDIRVVIIKLADRLHNMRTLENVSDEKKERTSRETMEIYAPLASRLGMYNIKKELEDISFYYLKPDAYKEIQRLVDKKQSERQDFVNDIIAALKERLDSVGIKAEISGRPKHFASIYMKMINQGRSFEEIYDLTAVRLIVDTVTDCYGALGIVHTLWTPLPGRFKDYIAMPKPNMYQSLHTTVIGLRKEPVEIQIRTKEMHQTAEYGIAAHWKYKEGIEGESSVDIKLAWLRQVMDFQNELRDVEEFVDSLKMDLFADQVFVFTPKGDVIDLPAGATPLDFAYRIHTEIGHRCIGTKVNGAIVPLDHVLSTGDIVQILTSKTASGPSRDWLRKVKTSGAKSKIRQWFKREQREEHIEQGYNMLKADFKRRNYDNKSILQNKEYNFVDDVLDDLHYTSMDDMLAAIGYGNVTVESVASRFIDYYREKYEAEQVFEDIIAKEKPLDVAAGGVRIQGIDNALIKLAKCCNPIPGDAIIGYITRGRGVTIHRADCQNVLYQSEAEEARYIDVLWADNSNILYPVPVQIVTSDRPGAIHAVLGEVSKMDINIFAMHSRGGTVYVTLEVRNVRQLNEIMRKINNVKDVTMVRRIR